MQLEELLGEALFAQVKAKIDEQNANEPDKLKHIRYADLSEGGYVGRGKYDALEAEKAALQQQVDTLTAAVADLKKNSKGNDALQATISDLTTKLEAVENQAAVQAKTYALKEALTKAGVLDADYLIFKAGGVEQFAFSDKGEPEKLEDTLKPYREDPAMAHLFQRPGGYTPKGGTPPTPENPFAKESYNLTKQGELFKTNPQRARELAKIAGVKID